MFRVQNPFVEARSPDTSPGSAASHAVLSLFPEYILKLELNLPLWNFGILLLQSLLSLFLSVISRVFSLFQNVLYMFNSHLIITHIYVQCDISMYVYKV
jgi:hypothetical protein